MDTNGVLAAAYNAAFTDLRVTAVTPVSNVSRPTDANGVWAAVFDGSTLRVVFV